MATPQSYKALAADIAQPLTRAKRNMTDSELTKSIYEHYKSEKKESISIAPLYAPYFGNTMIVTINGISIAVPCNGHNIEVPKTFAAEIRRRMIMIDTKIQRERGLKEQSIYEVSPGETKLF